MSGAREARGGPHLLPGVAGPSLWLALAIVVLSVAAGLELTAASAAIRAAVSWSPRLAGSVTVAVGGGGLESPQAAAARATEILARAPGLTKIALLEPDASDDAAGRLMGVPNGSNEAGGAASPPRLIAVTAANGDRASAAAIRQDLRRGKIIAAVDDHGVWTGPLERTAILAAASSMGLLLAIIALTWMFSAVGARAAVSGRASRVNLLLHLGATDDMILRPFRARIVGGAALGALVGLAAAVAIAAAGLWLGGPAHGLIAAAPVDAWDLAAATIWLPIVVLIAAWAAGGGVRARLRALA